MKPFAIGQMKRKVLEHKLNPLAVQDLTDYYNIDKEQVTEEMDILINFYKVAHTGIDISDMLVPDITTKNKISGDNKSNEPR